MQIGLVGKGFIGEAFYEGMKDHHQIAVWDIDPTKQTVQSIKELVAKCEIIFVSVPTPMEANGFADLSIVRRVLHQINYATVDHRIVVIRSTVPPRTCGWLSRMYKRISIVFNPEFLTEANHINDFKNQNRIVLGGDLGAVNSVAYVYESVFPTVPIIKTNWETAEMVKYLANSFLSVKVSFANEFKTICDAFDIDYDDVVNIATFDPRLGTSHWKVPGPDGHRGFGGTCFPKDVSAIRAICDLRDIPVPILDAIWKRNIEIDRPEKDWEQLKGRAVSN